MAHTTVIVMVDGLDPEYLENCPAPNFRELASKGFRTQVRAVMPTVTNVNNISLVTNSYPESHGITSNYWLDRESGFEHYMESGEFVLRACLRKPSLRRNVSAADRLTQNSTVKKRTT